MIGPIWFQIQYKDSNVDFLNFNIFKAMKSYEETWACLVCLRRVCENYQFLLDEDRKPLEGIVQLAFPVLEQLMQKFLESYNDQTGLLIKTVLKTFHHCVHLVLPQYLINPVTIQSWMTYFKIIIDSQVQPELGSTTIDENEMLRREKTYVWTNKKWAGRILQRFIQKFCNKRMAEKNQEQYSDYLLQTFGPVFLESFYQILITSQTQFQAPRTCLFALKYLYYAMKLPITGDLMANHFEKILFDIAIPAMQLTTRDDRLWKEDPEEYIRRLEDFSVASYNIKNAAQDLLEQTCKMKDANNTTYLVHFLNYAQQCLQSNIDPRTQQQLSILRREAILWGIESQCTKITKLQNINEQLENLLQQYIIPDLQSPVCFLRARACSLFSQYGTIEFKNRQNVVDVVSGIYKCILDKDLPVRVAAAIAFSSILQHQEAQDLIRPGLSQVLETYVKLMDVIDSEGIVKSLEDIVQNFQTEIAPFAVQLTQHLSNIFMKYCQKQSKVNEEDSEDDGETELAASGCLEAIKRILNAPLTEQTYVVIEPIIFPILNFCLTEKGCDFVNEALELLNLMLYKRKGGLTQSLWFYYPVLIYILVGLPQQVNVRAIPGLEEDQYQLLEGCKSEWGSEFLRQMLGSLRNFIQKGGDTLLSQNDMFGNNLASLIFRVIEKIYAIGENGNDETDTNAVTTLLITMMENFKGKIDGTIPQIIEVSLQNLQKNKSNRFKVVSLGVICIALHYNCQLTLAYLSSKQAVDSVFALMFSLQKNWKYQWDLHRLFLGVCTCYSLPTEQIPAYLLQNINPISKQMVEFTSRVLTAREEEESCENEEQAMEDDDQSYKQTLDKLQKIGAGQDDDDEDDEDDEEFDGDEDDDYANLYESPLEVIDEILLFEQLLITLQNQNPGLYQQMAGSLTQQEQEVLTKNIVEAKEQYADWVKSKASQQ